MELNMRVAFVTNICPHYRVRTFETLAAYYSVTYYFFSAGDEWYWQQQHGTRSGNFSHEYLRGVRLGGTRITPTLIPRLWREPCDVFVKCINGRFALPVTYLISHLRRKPFVLWTGIWMTLRTPFHRLIFPLTRHIYRHADAVVVYGEHVKRYLLSQGVDQKRIFVAAHAVDNSKYSRKVDDGEVRALREKFHLGKQRVLLYLGRLEPHKGMDYLLEAFFRLRAEDTFLLFVGEGSQKEELKRRVEQLGRTNQVHFADYMTAEQTPPYYALAYALVVPSITTRNAKETWGLVVNEAMNQGCPVIATDAVGAASGGLVQDGVNGLIVPERDSLALTAAIERLLDDPSLRECMSRRSRSIVAEWDNERMVAGFRLAIEYACRNSKVG
jgi:glycosyltransferase involved in cell wall biosynthesis